MPSVSPSKAHRASSSPKLARSKSKPAATSADNIIAPGDMFQVVYPGNGHHGKKYICTARGYWDAIEQHMIVFEIVGHKFQLVAHALPAHMCRRLP